MSPPSRRILLADADAFYVAIARMVDPEGAGRAELLIVGGTRESRGVVCSASYETRRFGVRSAMPISRALRLCPQAVCVPVPRGACSRKHREIRAVLDRFSPMVESASIDEWYMDLGGTEALYHNESLAETARRIRQAVLEETQIRVSIGGGTSKLVAKLAVERAKPKPGTGATGVHVVDAGDEGAFLATFSLADLPLVGPKFQQRLAKLGLTTVRDVLPYDAAALARWLGEREGFWLYDRVRGIDRSDVESHGDAKSISRDETFAEDIENDDDLQRELVALVTRAASDLRGDGLTARTITVRIRDFDFRTRSARRTLPRGVIADRVILGVAKSLLTKLRSERQVPARLLGVALSSLAADPDADQLALFEAASPEEESARDRALARAVDKLREKFGRDGIMPARLSEERP
jgi:DNA polymerase IV